MKDFGIRRLAMTGMVACLTLLSTMVFKIPTPATNGYVHLGDAMVYIGVLILGLRYGVASAAIGSALADILGGYFHWAPWTFAIKGIMALITGVVWKRLANVNGFKREIFGLPVAYIAGMAIAGIWMVAGYYAASAVIYGNWITPISSLPGNIGQFAVGMLLTAALAPAIRKIYQ